MKIKTVKTALVGTASIALVITLFIAVSVRSQEEDNKRQTARDAQLAGKERDDEATPIVDFEAQGAASADKNSQRALKNARYDKSDFVIGLPGSKEGSVRLYDDPRNPISDLPVEQSDLVVEAKVLSSEAFLSKDKSGVYSEFTVSVSRVLKIRQDLSVAPGNTVVAERMGGRVRYPSGKIIRYRVGDEGSPVIGARYLLFLKLTSTDNYRILTAYEVQGNKVFALDSSRINIRQLGQTIFDKHNGKEFSDFISEVEGAIQTSTSRKKTRATNP